MMRFLTAFRITCGCFVGQNKLCNSSVLFVIMSEAKDPISFNNAKSATL